MKCRIDFKVTRYYQEGEEFSHYFSSAGDTLGEAISAAIMLLIPHGNTQCGKSNIEVIRAGFFCEACRCYHSFDEAIVIHSEMPSSQEIPKEN